MNESRAQHDKNNRQTVINMRSDLKKSNPNQRNRPNPKRQEHKGQPTANR